jgi:hypothetical protein
MNFTRFTQILKFLENIKNLTAWTHCQGFINYETISNMIKYLTSGPTCHGFN